jgi:hypothetical protein
VWGVWRQAMTPTHRVSCFAVTGRPPRLAAQVTPLRAIASAIGLASRSVAGLVKATPPVVVPQAEGGRHVFRRKQKTRESVPAPEPRDTNARPPLDLLGTGDRPGSRGFPALVGQPWVAAVKPPTPRRPWV